jgi:uncharacterized membrane protein YqiK
MPKIKIIASIAITSLTLTICFLLAISIISKQRNLKSQRETAALRADSIRIAKENEIAQALALIDEARKTDSIKTAEETEQARIASSTKTAEEIEQMLAEDSIKNAEAAAAAERASRKTFYWGGTNDVIGQAILKKITPAGVKKAKCTGDGVKIIPDKATCRKDVSNEVSCFYSPKLTLTDCGGKEISFLGKNNIFKTKPKANEQAAKKELANDLLKTDFSDWVSVLKEGIK